MKKKLTCILVFLFGFSHILLSQKISNRVKLENTNLKSDYNYSAFTSNENYLAWAEFYTMQIFIYNLKTNEIDTVIQKRGRGPNEYIMISSLALTSDDKLIITDTVGIKLIVYDIKTGNYNKDVMLTKVKPYRTIALKDILFTSSRPPIIKSLNYIIELDSWQTSAIEMRKLIEEKEFLYPFKVEGRITANDTYGIQIAEYYPHIYVTNLKTKRFIKKIVFDDVEVEQGENMTYKGNKAFRPPTDAPILSKDVAVVPNSVDCIFILASGKSAQQNYKPDELKIYNFIEEDFTGTLELDISASKIMVAGNYLYVYSKDENGIFRYEIESEY